MRTILLFLLLCGPAWADLPIVAEHYDSVVVVHLEQCDLQKVVFIRANRIIAERMVHSEMLWTEQSGRFLLVFDDYGMARRHIAFDRLTEWDGMPPDAAEQLEWWNQAVRRTDLQAPP